MLYSVLMTLVGWICPAYLYVEECMEKIRWRRHSLETGWRLHFPSSSFLGTWCFRLYPHLIFNILFPGSFLFVVSDDVMILRPDLNLVDVTRVQDFVVHFVDVVLEMRPGGGRKQAVLNRTCKSWCGRCEPKVLQILLLAVCPRALLCSVFSFL